MEAGGIVTGNMRIVRLWRAAMGRETHLFKDISKGKMKVHCPGAGLGKFFYW